MQRRSTSILSRLLPAALSLALIVSAVPASVLAAGTRRYAIVGGATSGSCNSWANACELYYALNSSASGDQVWVRAGVYLPQGTLPSGSLNVPDGVQLYGGFEGDETLLSQRNVSANAVVLSGDINLDGTPTGNSYHVVKLINDTNLTLMDGFTIVRGNASGSAPDDTGGGMLIDGGAPRLQNMSFVDNAASYGGGLAIINAASPVLVNASFVDNTAGGNSAPPGVGGGGLLMLNSSLSLSKASFTGNSGGDGGAMQVGSSTLSLSQVNFSGNLAFDGGGGLNSYSSANSLTNVSFTGNRAVFGGGSFINGGSATLSKVRFNGNSVAGGNGGGLYINATDGPIALTDVSFTANSTDGEGGGMYTDYAVFPMTLKNVTFANNTSTVAGAAMYNSRATKMALTNVTVSGNSAPGGGGGFYNDQSTVTLKFVTFSKNATTGDGAAMLNANASTVHVFNSIFWGDTGAPEITNLDTSGGDFNHGILMGGCASVLSAFTTCTAASKNPKLGSLKNNGGFTKTMALASTSPAIEKVSCAGVKTDQRGVKRPQGLKCDMGAYEFVP